MPLYPEQKQEIPIPYYIFTQETFLITHYRAMVEAIRKEDAVLCPPKPKKARTRADIAKAGIALNKKKHGKKPWQDGAFMICI